MGDLSRQKLHNWRKWCGVMLASILAIGVCAFYAGLVAVHYEVSSDKVTDGARVRIVLIFDLHSHVYGDDQQPLLDKISAQRPDVIALAGDIVDDDEPQDGSCMFLEKVSAIAPVYFVSGNHEYWSGQYDAIREMIAGYGIVVLSNESVRIRVNGVDINMCGIDDPDVMKYTRDPQLLAMDDADELLERFDDIGDDAVNVLLAHRAERVDAYRQYDFDVVLSGHAHGGQIRLPLILNGLFAPSQGFFPKYAGGAFEQDGQTMIVSRGLSFNRYVPRVFNPPEVVVVDIVGEG